MAMSEGKHSMTAGPSVSVVIPVYNEARRIRECLTALAAQQPGPDEVIVVDNNCSDDTIAIVREFPGVRIVAEPRQGITYARATGFDAASSEVIAGIDADTRVGKGWLAEIRSQFGGDPDLAALAGGAGVKELSPGTRCWGSWYYRLFRFWHERSIGLGPMLYGFNSAFTTDAWQAVRDQVTFEDGQVNEDVDLTIVLLKNGYRIRRSERARVACELFNSIDFAKLKRYYRADSLALTRHRYGNRRRWL